MSGPLSSSTHGILHFGSAGGGGLRWVLADVAPLVEEARQQRDLSPASAIGLGQMMTAAAMLSRLIAKQPLRLVLEAAGDGPLGRIRAEADTIGRLRGLVQERLARTATRGGGDIDLGSGKLSVLRQLGGQRYESKVELVDGGIARNVANFLERSEQINSAVLLGVLARPQGIVAGGGLILQAMPAADPLLLTELERQIAGLPSVSKLLDDGGAWRLLEAILGAADYEALEERHLVLACDCDRERFSRHIRALAHEDPSLVDLEAPTRVECSFCGAEYSFEAAELAHSIN